MNILIYVTGDRDKGMGHIMRQVVLGKALIDRGHSVDYLTASDTPGYSMLTRQPFLRAAPFVYRGNAPSSDLFQKLLSEICIIDIEHGPSEEVLASAKKYSGKLVTIGGVGFRITDQASVDSLVDLQIYQSPVINANSMSQATSRRLVGLEYIILDESFLNARAVYTMRQNEPINKKHILVSMGGADPHNLTWELSDSLAKAFPEMQIVSVYGPAAKKSMRRVDSSNVTIIESPPPGQFAQLMSESCLIITALGMTVYEAMCVGVPICCTAWSEDHAETALYLSSKSALQYLDTWDKIDKAMMFAFAHNVIFLKTYRQTKTRIEHKLIDGLGTEKVVRALEELGQ